MTKEKTHLIAALRKDEQHSTRVFADPRASWSCCMSTSAKSRLCGIGIRGNFSKIILTRSRIKFVSSQNIQLHKYLNLKITITKQIIRYVNKVYKTSYIWSYALEDLSIWILYSYIWKMSDNQYLTNLILLYFTLSSILLDTYKSFWTTKVL